MAATWVYPNVGTQDEWSVPGWLVPAGLTGDAGGVAEMTFAVPAVVTSFAAPAVRTTFAVPAVPTSFPLPDPEPH